MKHILKCCSLSEYKSSVNVLIAQLVKKAKVAYYKIYNQISDGQLYGFRNISSRYTTELADY